MGLLKAAIIIGAGGYAINKFSKSREGHGCGCSRKQKRDIDTPNDLSNSNENIAGNTFIPGTKVVGPGQVPAYRQEKALPYDTQEREFLNDKEGWVESEKEFGGRKGGL